MSSNEGIDKLRAIEQQFDRERASVVDRKSLEDIRTRYLSRKSGLLTLQLQNLGQLPREQRADFGQAANKVKAKIEASLETLQTAIVEREQHGSDRRHQGEDRDPQAGARKSHP